MLRFTRLKVWQRSHQLALEVYGESSAFPRHEVYGVTSQLRRAVVSVAANIAEGSKRRSDKEYAHFLGVAEGSLAEVEYLLMLSRDLGYLPEESAARLAGVATEVASMLAALRRRIEGNSSRVAEASSS